ncbi:MAG: class II glutamine amidotransferase [Myxococcales bacterium]|nr:class II glutamine amidotransferase [Myxococcales bacterium]
MCRLFGFRSIIASQVHSSLLAAENALGTQSNAHPDGWGVAFYLQGAPHVTRSPQTALGDHLFHRLSGVVSSETVLAHVRKATQGDLGVLNCHPFQHGRWVFAHNGDIPNFAERKPRLLEQVEPSLKRFILGDTDSEVFFHLLLGKIAERYPLNERHRTDEVIDAMRDTIGLIRDICDDPSSTGSDDSRGCLLTAMVTDGDVMVSVHGGKELFLSTYKTRCSDRDACGSLSPECEAPSQSGRVNHCIVSSEPLQGENVWNELRPGEIIGVDHAMRVTRAHLDGRNLALIQ